MEPPAGAYPVILHGRKGGIMIGIKFRVWGHTKQRVELVKYLLIEGSKIKHKYKTGKAESYFSNPIIEQYTGLKDWYAGDVLKSFSHTDRDGSDYYLYHVIIYSEKYAAFMAIDKTNYENGNFDLHNGNVLLYQMEKHNAVKYGNIHEK